MKTAREKQKKCDKMRQKIQGNRRKNQGDFNRYESGILCATQKKTGDKLVAGFVCFVAREALQLIC